MASSDREMLTMTEYARTRGVSVPYISKLKKLGKLKFEGKLIDRAAADAALAGSADPAKQVARAPKAAATASAAPVEFVESPIAKATAKDRDASAEIKLLRIERERGRVVDSEGVILAVADNSETAILLLNALPDRIALTLAEEGDVRKVRAILVKEIDAVCQSIAKAARAFPQKLVPSN